MSVSRPSILYRVNTGGSDQVPPTSGHQASGWSANSVPGAREISTLWQNQCDWLAYLASKVQDTQAFYVPMSSSTIRIVSGGVTGGAPIFGLVISDNSEIQIPLFPIPVAMTPGTTANLASVDVYCGAGAGSGTVTGQLKRVVADTGATSTISSAITIPHSATTNIPVNVASAADGVTLIDIITPNDGTTLVIISLAVNLVVGG